MGKSTEQWLALLEAGEFWPRIIADDQFWQEFAALEPHERDTAFMMRVRSDPGFVSESSAQVREQRTVQAGLLMALVEMVGVAEALNTVRRRVH